MRLLYFLFLVMPWTLIAQNFTPGERYFDQNEYIEYMHGNLPLILSVPHGGEKKPIEVADRECDGCVYIKDAFTQELANEIAGFIHDRTGCYPFMIINRLHREKLDANRSILTGADEDPLAEGAWEYYHSHIDTAKLYVNDLHGKGLFIDVHGHGHEVQRLELGYLLSKNHLQLSNQELDDEEYLDRSSIRHLAKENKNNLSFSALLRGESAFGTFMENASYPATPSFQDPAPMASELYFSGGYNTLSYGSKEGGTIDAIQIECNQDVRFDSDIRLEFAAAVADELIDFLELHYFDYSFDMQCFVSSVPSLEASDAVVYPNPSSSNWKLEYGAAANIEVFDVMGNQIHHYSHIPGNTQIHGENFPSGLYTLKIVNADQRISFKKLIKI